MRGPWFMAGKNEELARKRQEVKARQRAAGQKISRLKGKGVDLAGTKHDPRRNTANIDKYNMRQLDAHLNRLNTFTDRGTRFVGDAYRRPLPHKVWSTQQKLERQLNARKQAAFKKLKDIVLPRTGGTTIGQRQNIIRPDRPTAGNPSVNPYFLRKRKSSAFKNAKSLKKMNDHLKKRLSSDFIAEDIKLARRIAEDMTRELNRPDIQAMLAGLNDTEFDVLWNFSGFATDLALPYSLARAQLEDTDSNDPSQWHARMLDENLVEAVNKIDDIKTLKLGR